MRSGFGSTTPCPPATDWILIAVQEAGAESLSTSSASSVASGLHGAVGRLRASSEWPPIAHRYPTWPRRIPLEEAMPLDEQRFPELIRDLYRIVGELVTMFPGRPFTPDGHMVGSLAECYAEY